jgi:hypothetical protein
MVLSLLILENKWILELFYALIISSICLIIFFKADRFFKLSSHRGIKYFRNAFLFYCVAFIARYIFGIFSDLSWTYSEILRVSFEYFIIMAGFFLLYSLIWKKIESSKKTSSLLNGRIFIFHLIALILAILDGLWQTYDFMFFSQMFIFFCASIIALSNSIKDGKNHKFLGSYFIAMLLGLTAWVLNFVVATFLNWRHLVLIDIGIINLTFFLLFLYGVVKITKNGSKKA